MQTLYEFNTISLISKVSFPLLRSCPAGSYLFKVNSENPKTIWRLFKVNNKDTRKMPMRSVLMFLAFLLFEHISHIVLAFPLSTALNEEMSAWWDPMQLLGVEWLVGYGVVLLTLNREIWAGFLLFQFLRYGSVGTNWKSWVFSTFVVTPEQIFKTFIIFTKSLKASKELQL